MFPELRTELERLSASEASKDKEFVINRYRCPDRSNLRQQFSRIVEAAGVRLIPRPFDNMRASRATEVYAEFGAYYESQWIGHSAKVARDHYLQVREEDFERAVGEKTLEKAGKNSVPATKKSFPAFFPAAQDRNSLHNIEAIRQAKTADS